MGHGFRLRSGSRVAAGWFATLPGRGLHRHSPRIGKLLALLAAIISADLAIPLAQHAAAPAAVVWPGCGLLLGMLMVCPPSQTLAYLVVGTAGMAVSSTVLAAPVALCLAAALAKGVGIAAAALALRHRLGRSTDLSRPGLLRLFAATAAGAAPAATALLIAAATAETGGGDPMQTAVTAFLAQSLGITLVAPAFLTIYRGGLHAVLERRQWIETLSLGALLAASLVLGFTQHAPALLFVPFAPLMLVVARRQFIGATLALPLVGAIAIGCTLAGFGPADTAPRGTSGGLVILQVFLAVAALMALPAGVLTAQRRRLDLGLAVRESRARFAEALLRTSELQHRVLSENASDIISRFDLNGRRLYVSQSARDILGWTEAEMTGPDWPNRVHPDDRPAFDRAGDEMREAQERIVATYRYARPDGSWAWIEARLRLLRDACGVPTGYISNARDITQQKQTEQALAQAMDELSVLATTDGLTGIANRRRFDETLRREWRRAMRANEAVSLLMIDVDHFKHFNDLYGHRQGDACLRMIATTMAALTRRPGDLCARYGGEEFAVILPNTTLEGATDMAERMRAAVAARQQAHSGIGCGVVSISVGAATAVPARHSTIATLLEDADEALYRAKRAGRNQVAAFEKKPMATARDAVDEPGTPDTAPDTVHDTRTPGRRFGG